MYEKKKKKKLVFANCRRRISRIEAERHWITLNPVASDDIRVYNRHVLSWCSLRKSMCKRNAQVPMKEKGTKSLLDRSLHIYGDKKTFQKTLRSIERKKIEKGRKKMQKDFQPCGLTFNRTFLPWLSVLVGWREILGNLDDYTLHLVFTSFGKQKNFLGKMRGKFQVFFEK